MLLKLSSSVYYYKAKTDLEDASIQNKLTELAESHRRWGFWKMYHYIRGQAMPWNHKRVYRIYTQLNLNIRRKPKKRLPSRTRESLFQPELPNSVWSMDFMYDRLNNGRSFRRLNIPGDFNRDIVNIVVDTSISPPRVAREFTPLFEWRGKPKMIRVDNGPEFLALAEWCKSNGVELKFIQPAKPNQNAYIERFNRTYRDEVLGAYLFEDLHQVRFETERFIWKYNNVRPHDSLQNITPRAFLLKCGKLSAAKPTLSIPHSNKGFTMIIRIFERSYLWEAYVKTIFFVPDIQLIL